MKKIIIQILLAGLAIFLAYLCYESVITPIEFQKIKDQRYAKVIQRLKDIRTAQEGYKSVHGVYTASFDTLIHFVKYDSLKTVRSIGELTDEQIDAGMTEQDALKKGLIIRDTIKVAALEKLFGENYPIDELRYVPFTNKKHEFKMGTNMIWSDASAIEIPVFEARISNMEIFENIMDDYGDAVLQENGERIRLQKYPGLKVGSVKEANNNIGNWE